MDIAFRKMVQKRAGWLTALFLGEMLTATAMGFFEKEIAKAVVLALFVPLIISSGGNSGSQASTLVIRALALGEVTLRDWWRVMRREIGARAGARRHPRRRLVSCGSRSGRRFRPSTGRTGCWWRSPSRWRWSASCCGARSSDRCCPSCLRRLGFDPATSSAPFVATLVDVTGLVIYFTVGIVVLRGTVL